MKLFHPLAAVLTFVAPWFAVAPAMAQTMPPQEQQCQSALLAAQDLLLDGRTLWLTNSSVHNLEDEYFSYPYQSPMELVFVMAGDSAPDMMSSPRLLTSITETVRRGCPAVGMVTFGVDGSDWSTSFGLIGNQIREFECVDPEVDSQPQWGYRSCV